MVFLHFFKKKRTKKNLANGEDPDQTGHDLGLHCLPISIKRLLGLFE